MTPEQTRTAAVADPPAGRRTAGAPAHRLLVPGTAAGAADPLLVGHKFARQARLSALGHRVPDFVCLSVGAFDAVRAATGVRSPAVRDSGELAAWAARARAEVHGAGVPADLAEALLDAFDRLSDDGAAVAVRSCAVPARVRGTGAADAAASPCFLAVGREELVDRVSRCWAAAFSTERVLDRLVRGEDPAATRMAVGLQRVVRAECSFTAVGRVPHRAPGTADLSHLAAAYGLGRGPGRGDADHFSVDAASGVVELRTVRKTRQTVLAPTGGTVVVEVPEAAAHRAVLDLATVRRVAALARGLEEHFGAPQEVAGAVTADGGIHLLGTRPATTARPGRRH
ncbi:hypothetical protein Kpho02_71630 [Kitasatospora phosalacinea]|uniref:Phosphoenolpyruvate synthase n=1 Tax=Kitasatospora phosalacinea TaxID=2065 RepID=A0A9W6V4M1_9ACTN|nr:PEP/pyruvate-binding domain-containing protein [Kitasatospora phosalacinea]GLW74866.1 hypothetical protein Kpho02_71630 [Kitasatospora phosalacinea]